MRCPYCSTPSLEADVACQACGFCLDKVDQHFGAVPHLLAGITDLQSAFGRATKKVEAAIREFERKFPQTRFSVVTTEQGMEMPLAVYAFWIFNRGGIPQDLNKGGKNRDILLTIDVVNGRANLLVGYGLEPFIGPEALQETVTNAKTEFEAGGFADGTVKVIEALCDRMSKICREMDQTYGISVQSLYDEEQRAKPKEPQTVTNTEDY